MKRRKNLLISLAVVMVVSLAVSFLSYISFRGIPISPKSVDIAEVSQKGNEISFELTVTQQSGFFGCMKGYTFDVDEEMDVITCHVAQKPKFLMEEEGPKNYTIRIPKEESTKAVYYGSAKNGILVWKKQAD